MEFQENDLKRKTFVAINMSNEKAVVGHRIIVLNMQNMLKYTVHIFFNIFIFKVLRICVFKVFTGGGLRQRSQLFIGIFVHFEMLF